jgi:hypothetical protein
MKCGCKKGNLFTRVHMLPFNFLCVTLVIIDATYFAKIMKKTTKLLHCSIEELHGILIYPQNDGNRHDCTDCEDDVLL